MAYDRNHGVSRRKILSSTTISTVTAPASVTEARSSRGQRGQPDLRLWRIDCHAHYGPLDGLARNPINTRLIAGRWDEICRLTTSLRACAVAPSAILRTLQRGPAPSSLARALAELGMTAGRPGLACCDENDYHFKYRPALLQPGSKR